MSSELFLEWVAFNNFIDVEYISHGGFSQIYKATWKKKRKQVALKVIDDSQNVTAKFLKEVINHFISLTLLLILVTATFYFKIF